MLTWKDVLEAAKTPPPKPPKRVEKTPDEWRALLDAETYRVTRQSGTERPFSGELCARFEPGIYACACCHTPLFDSNQKFESGTGWPSFTQGVTDNVLQHHSDESHGMQRIEVLCNVCDAHLGHVFPDGPAPSGLRYCINSLSLEKVKE